MSYGLEVWNSHGQRIFRSLAMHAKIIAAGVISFPGGAATRTLSVPGITNSDTVIITYMNLPGRLAVTGKSNNTLTLYSQWGMFSEPYSVSITVARL